MINIDELIPGSTKVIWIAYNKIYTFDSFTKTGVTITCLDKRNRTWYQYKSIKTFLSKFEIIGG